MIESRLLQTQPAIILVAFRNRISLSEISASRDFGNVIKGLAGRPFRVLCDFAHTVTMPEEVSSVFLRAQEFAVARGMERDAFVCTSSILELQFTRIARESGRRASLGPLRFFDSNEEALAYLLETSG